MSGGVEINETTLQHAKQLRQLKFQAFNLIKKMREKDWRNPINSCMLIKRTYIDKKGRETL